MKSEEKNYFNAVADSFDADFNAYSRPAGILRVEKRVKLFMEYCSLKPGLKILEIGCGTGEYSKALFGRGLNLFATDISFNMLRHAKNKLNRTKRVMFFVSDISLFPFAADSFDVILGNSILHHLEIEESLKEIHRVLRKNGRFAFSEPNMCNPQIFLQKRIKSLKKLVGDSPGEKDFSRWALRRMFEMAGFKNIIVRPFDFLHPYTPAALVKAADKIGTFLERTPLREIAGSLFITGEK
ncbi:MAG: methyltransferase domain-containing protein [Candidatus Omnitrophota bacterium]